MALGSVLKAGRKAKGLTLQQLADRVGAKLSSIVKYEMAGEKHGNYPPVPMLAKLAVELDLPPALLLAETLEDEESRNQLRTRELEAAQSLVNAFGAFSSVVGALNLSLDVGREALAKILGPLEILPTRLQDDALYALDPKSYFAKLTGTENGPDHGSQGPGRRNSPTNNPDAAPTASTRKSKGSP